MASIVRLGKLRIRFSDRKWPHRAATRLQGKPQPCTVPRFASASDALGTVSLLSQSVPIVFHSCLTDVSESSRYPYPLSYKMRQSETKWDRFLANTHSSATGLPSQLVLELPSSLATKGRWCRAFMRVQDVDRTVGPDTALTSRTTPATGHPPLLGPVPAAIVTPLSRLA